MSSYGDHLHWTLTWQLNSHSIREFLLLLTRQPHFSTWQLSYTIEVFLCFIQGMGNLGEIMKVCWMLNEDVDRVTGCMRWHRALCGVKGVTVTSTALLLLKRIHYKQVRQPRYWSWLWSGGCLNCIDTDETFTFQEFLLFTKFFQLAAVCVFQTEQWADIWGRELVPIFINLIPVHGRHQHNIIIAVGLL